MHKNTLIFTHIVVFESETWSVFKQNFTGNTSKLYKIVKFWYIFQNFGKYQAKSSLYGEFCRILLKFY